MKHALLVVALLALPSCSAADAVSSAVCPIIDTFSSAVASTVEVAEDGSQSLEGRRSSTLEKLDSLDAKVLTFVNAVEKVPELGSAADVRADLLARASAIQDRLQVARDATLAAPSLNDLPDLSAVDLSMVVNKLDCS